MAKNKQSNLIACLRMIIIGFIKKYIVLLRNRGGGKRLAIKY